MAANSKQARDWRDRYGPWALVTGASDGIGREIAVGLAQRGLNLVLVARRADVLEGLAAQLSSAHGVDCKAVAADLSSQPEVDRVMAEAGQLDLGLLVAAAGFGLSGPATETSLPGELNMIDVNCRAATAMTYMLLPHLVARGRGGIILMSSLLASQGVPRAANYAATKAYIQTLAEGLQLEVAGAGVDVLASAPGPVKSGFADRADMRMSLSLSSRAAARGTLRALGRKKTVRPGWLSKFLEASLWPLPRAGRSRILGMVMKGMTSHQDARDTKTQKTA